MARLDVLDHDALSENSIFSSTFPAAFFPFLGIHDIYSYKNNTDPPNSLYIYLHIFEFALCCQISLHRVSQTAQLTNSTMSQLEKVLHEVVEVRLCFGFIFVFSLLLILLFLPSTTEDLFFVYLLVQVLIPYLLHCLTHALHPVFVFVFNRMNTL